jgi:ectoine hydroxylase-related dioxygenase (phytanoyl-CoA dioxygenase family)
MDPQLSEEYDRRGFLVFDPGIPMETIDAANAALKDLYLPEGSGIETTSGIVPYRNDRRIQDAWKAVAPVKAIATAPKVMELLAKLYGRAPKPFQTLNFKLGTEQPPHSDTIHFNSSPSGYMCGVWVALEDIDRDNGPLVYYPGSHKWPEITMAEVDAYGSTESSLQRLVARVRRHFRGPEREHNVDYPRYEAVIQSKIAASGIAPEFATIRKGQASPWAANLVHGGSPRNDRSRTRLSQVTHYFFEGCRYYTPLMERGWRTQWRNPAWIE